MRPVIEGSGTAGGVLNRDYVDSVGAARVFLRAAHGSSASERWEPDTAKVLGRADLAWKHLAIQLINCGLAPPLAPALNDAALTRWAPDFFLQWLRTGALRDAMRAAVRREALRHIAQALHEMGARGVLLKGAALAALAEEREAAPKRAMAANAEAIGAAVVTTSRSTPVRSCSDIDVYVRPEWAPLLHSRLQEIGFSVLEESPATAHHLSGLYFHGMLLEIHTRIMDPRLGLPEKEMLARARPLNVPGLAEFDVLDAEGLLLHAVMHVTHHRFFYGLKSAWDILWIIDKYPDLDWERLAFWISACRVPLGFHVPLRVLRQELDLALPSGLLEISADIANRGSRSVRQRHLESIARLHLFSDVSNYPGNPFIGSAIWLLLYESWFHRAGEIGKLIRFMYSGTVRRWKTRHEASAPLRPTRVAQLRRALLQWRQVRSIQQSQKSGPRAPG